ncbi:MAG: hypothetical protein ABWY19_13675 [Marmoricola sp.]
MSLDSATWAALALVLTLVGAALSFLAWRRRGPASGLRGLAWTLLPVAAWLTGTLKLAGNIVDDVTDWAARLVFSPSVWLGIVVAGAAVVLWFVSGAMLARGVGTRGVPGRDRAEAVPGQDRKQVSAKPAKKKAARDDDLDDMDDIEAILKKHGI